MNLPESISRQIERCTRLQVEYEALGAAGAIGATVIQATIERAHTIVGEGDIIHMMKIYTELEGIE